MTKDPIEILLEPLQCREYSPYHSFSRPECKAFKTPEGAVEDTSNSDSEALFEVGHEAYQHLVSTYKPEYLEDYHEHWRAVSELSKIRLDELVNANGESALTDPAPITGEYIAYDMYRRPGKELDLQDTCLVTSHLFSCFVQIDNALTHLKSGTAGAVDAGVAAAKQLERAKALFRGSETVKDTLRGAASSAASKAALARHDRNNVDRKIVQDCHEEWRSKPTRYPSIAAFARDMIGKCEKVKDTRTIERWVREWGGSPRN